MKTKSHPKTEQAINNLEAWINQFDTPGMLEIIGSAKENPVSYYGFAVAAAMIQLFLPEIREKLDEHFK